jgi:hypothetical protein
MKHRVLQYIRRTVPYPRRRGISHPSNALSTGCHVRSSSTDSGLVLLAINTGLLFTCNHTGRQVWEGLAAGQSPVIIAANLSREYGLSKDWMHACVGQFVGELLRLGLVSADAGGRR